MAKPEECRYTETHEWAWRQGDKAVVGLTDHAQKEITDVVFVDLPKPGKAVKAGEACAAVESVKATFDINAPLDGEVLEVNAELSKDPALVNQSPHDKGWFFAMKVGDPKGWDALMDLAAYEEFLRARAH